MAIAEPVAQRLYAFAAQPTSEKLETRRLEWLPLPLPAVFRNSVEFR